MGRRSIYHGRELNIPWLGSRYTIGRVDIRGVGGRYTMGRGFDIAWIKGSKYHG